MSVDAGEVCEANCLSLPSPPRGQFAAVIDAPLQIDRYSCAGTRSSPVPAEVVQNGFGAGYGLAGADGFTQGVEARQPPFAFLKRRGRRGSGRFHQLGLVMNRLAPRRHPRMRRTVFFAFFRSATILLLHSRSQRGKFARMKDWSECLEVERNPERVSGAWLFRGTRVPVGALFANLEDGATVDEFLEWFPGVTRRQVEAVLNFAASSLEPLRVA